jgi:hypothetical protein
MRNNQQGLRRMTILKFRTANMDHHQIRTPREKIIDSKSGTPPNQKISGNKLWAAILKLQKLILII